MYLTTYKKSLPVFTCDVHEEFKLKNVLLLKMCYIGTSAHANSPQSCLTLCNPMYCSPPGSSVHGLLQARYWSGLPFPPSGDLLNPGIEPISLMSPSLVGRFFTTSPTWGVLEPLYMPYIGAYIVCLNIYIYDFNSYVYLVYNIHQFLIDWWYYFKRRKWQPTPVILPAKFHG